MMKSSKHTLERPPCPSYLKAEVLPTPAESARSQRMLKWESALIGSPLPPHCQPQLITQ